VPQDAASGEEGKAEVEIEETIEVKTVVKKGSFMEKFAAIEKDLDQTSLSSSPATDLSQFRREVCIHTHTHVYVNVCSCIYMYIHRGICISKNLCTRVYMYMHRSDVLVIVACDGSFAVLSRGLHTHT